MTALLGTIALACFLGMIFALLRLDVERGAGRWDDAQMSAAWLCAVERVEDGGYPLVEAFIEREDRLLASRQPRFDRTEPHGRYYNVAVMHALRALARA